MAQQTDAQLQTLSIQIRDEVLAGANTATRVGTLFSDMVDSKFNTGSVSTNTSLGTSDGLVPSQNAVRTYVTNVSSSIATSITNLSSSIVNMPNDKIYAAILTQNGSAGSAPTATVIRNTLGFTPTWQYVGEGEYRISETFDYRYTTFTKGDSQIVGTQAVLGNIWVYSVVSSGFNARVHVKTATSTRELDGLLDKTPIEIHVYQ